MQMDLANGLRHRHLSQVQMREIKESRSLVPNDEQQCQSQNQAWFGVAMTANVKQDKLAKIDPARWSLLTS